VVRSVDRNHARQTGHGSTLICSRIKRKVPSILPRVDLTHRPRTSCRGRSVRHAHNHAAELVNLSCPRYELHFMIR
jgi:hypothetical protein